VAIVLVDNNVSHAGADLAGRIAVSLRHSYSTETRTTPACIMPSARAALNDTSITRPLTNGPRSFTRQRI